MATKFQEYQQLDLARINRAVLETWEDQQTFEQSIDSRKERPSFVFYEGPPSANGLPGIHHVIARTIKDIFCRYKTQKGFLVHRKAGWDTHGLPVELAVEKKLGITKEDIGKGISVNEYNQTCRKEVMRYTDIWEDLTKKMGYWVDMSKPYITYDNRYIETLWWLLKQLYDKGLLYKGYTIQPYSPAAGTGLSTHELNQPGCYRDVKDTTLVAQFKVVADDKSEFLFRDTDSDLFFLAWTTTPWTLPSNTALAVGAKITYLKVRTFNVYTGKAITVILAKDLFNQHFSPKNKDLRLEDYKVGDKKVPYEIVGQYSGQQLEGIRYEQLIAWQQPDDGDAFRVLTGDFVTTEDGTGIVHLAPSFGADDFRVAKQNGVGSLTLVDRQGRFIDGCGEFSGRYVKNAYDDKLSDKDPSVDVDLAVMLKKENKAFKIEKHEHSYPHCWRTDKPVLYYPLDSWFVRSTALRDRMIELNNTINWKPPSTGSGRFGKWLENLQDWNLSRSRFWGTPLPIWRSEDGSEEKCIGSVEELKEEIDKAVDAGFMSENPLKDFVPGDNSQDNYDRFDLHRPFVDEVVLLSADGKKMYREPDLIDVWFDSGAMPYAQLHYPFEHKEDFGQLFPADFIAEGVDQTRGWFFTLHAIATMLFDSVAYKNLVSNGLVLDKNGQKMSKRLGNHVDPFKAIDAHGADAVRWYMIGNAQPWDSLKFDTGGVEEVKRKFFGTLYNTYSFFALYANIDGFQHKEALIPIDQRPEIDRWVLSLLNSLIKEVEDHYENYEPTRAVRAIQLFVLENLSNWYVRLNRKRFWGGDYDQDKLSAYQTLYACLENIALLAAPVAPFYMDRLFADLNNITGRLSVTSVHLTDFPKADESLINTALEERMAIAQSVSSMVLGLRRKVNLKVRQPLSKLMIPILDARLQAQIESVRDIILSEVNVKGVEYIEDTAGILVKKIKPNFKALGPKYGKMMKKISQAINAFDQADIVAFEQEQHYTLKLDEQDITLSLEDVEILSEDIPGWLVASEGKLTVALDITITEELQHEGIAREFINRIQNLRKDSGLEVTDKINLRIQKHPAIDKAIEKHVDYIGAQTLAEKVELLDTVDANAHYAIDVDLEDDVKTVIQLSKADV